MKRTLVVIAALLASTASSMPDESLLTGRWVADLQSQSGLPTDVYVVSNGTYACESCAPKRHYSADGRLRLVDPAGNVSESVTIIDAKTISTHIVQPDLNRVTTMEVSRDGQTATYVSIDRRAGITEPLRTEYLARRTAAGPPGSHAISGSWEGVRYVRVPEQLRTTCLRDTGDQLTYRTGAGFNFTARFGGEFFPLRGPYDGGVSVAVEKVSPYRIVETRRRGGRTIQVRTYTVSRDGSYMETATTNSVTNETFRIASRRKGAPDPGCRSRERPA